MKKALLIHGAYGNPKENWFPWLTKELEKKGYKVTIPSFPTPINQSFKNWELELLPYLKKIDENSIVIAHSIGVVFILKILEKNDLCPRNIYFISGFLSKLGIERFDNINKTFYQKINFTKINRYSPQVYIYHSDNDPYVNQKHAIELARNIPGSRLTIIKKAGHFNIDSGFKEFPELLNDILNS